MFESVYTLLSIPVYRNLLAGMYMRVCICADVYMYIYIWTYTYMCMYALLCVKVQMTFLFEFPLLNWFSLHFHVYFFIHSFITAAMAALYFTVTGVQFWGTSSMPPFLLLTACSSYALPVDRHLGCSQVCWVSVLIVDMVMLIVIIAALLCFSLILLFWCFRYYNYWCFRYYNYWCFRYYNYWCFIMTTNLTIILNCIILKYTISSHTN
jgi:hypothetical protein